MILWQRRSWPLRPDPVSAQASVLTFSVGGTLLRWWVGISEAFQLACLSPRPFRGLIYSYTTLKITTSRDMLANTRNLLALIARMHTKGVVAFFQYGISLR